MVSLCRGFIRARRFKLLSEHPANRALGSNAPKYATVYEYNTTDFPGDQLLVVASTKWSKRIIPNLQNIDRSSWQIIHSGGVSTRL
jgi:hypothetical protein